MADLFDTSVLVGVVRRLPPTRTFLRSTFFPAVVTADTEEVAFDIENGTRRLAPLVSPLVEGRNTAQISFTTDTIKPAYVKPKTALRPNQPLKRFMGEQIGGGDMSPQQRREAAVTLTIQQHIEDIDRRLEWMASSILANGTLVLSGDSYPSRTLNFQRAAGQTLQLAGGARWGEAGVSPVDDLDTWIDTVATGSGTAVDKIVIGTQALGFLRADPKYEKMIDRTLGQTAEGRMGVVGAALDGVLIGRFGAQGIELWAYSATYTDDAGNPQRYVNTLDVLLVASAQGVGLDGVQAFGSIQDEAFAYGALAYAPKTWLEQDPAVRQVMTQSAPVLYPSRINASMRVRVR